MCEGSCGALFSVTETSGCTVFARFVRSDACAWNGEGPDDEAVCGLVLYEWHFCKRKYEDGVIGITKGTRVFDARVQRILYRRCEENGCIDVRRRAGRPGKGVQ